jgi:adenylate kinase family enzyme
VGGALTGARDDAGFTVEIAGAAGSGKSTVADALHANPALGLERYRLPRIRSLPSAARGAARAAVTLWREPDPRGFAFDLGLLAQYEAMAADLRRRSPRSSRFLIDQGPVYFQALCRYLILRGPRRERLFARIAPTLDRVAPALDAVIYLDAPDELLLARIAARPKAHMIKDFSRADALAFLAGYRATYRAILDRLAADGGVPVLRIDTATARPEEVTARVAAELARITSCGAENGSGTERAP